MHLYRSHHAFLECAKQHHGGTFINRSEAVSGDLSCMISKFGLASIKHPNISSLTSHQHDMLWCNVRTGAFLEGKQKPLKHVAVHERCTCYSISCHRHMASAVIQARYWSCLNGQAEAIRARQQAQKVRTHGTKRWKWISQGLQGFDSEPARVAKPSKSMSCMSSAACAYVCSIDWLFWACHWCLGTNALIQWPSYPA